MIRQIRENVAGESFPRAKMRGKEKLRAAVGGAADEVVLLAVQEGSGVGFGDRNAAWAPADGLAPASEKVVVDELLLVDRQRYVCVRRDVEGVDGAVCFAHEAGLAVRFSGDNRSCSLHLVEDIRWANLDTQVALNAAGCAD